MELNQQDNNRATRQWWRSPWSYRESIAVVLGFLLVGMVLQISIGAFDYDIIRFPMNIVVLCAVLFVVLLFSLKQQSAFFLWLSGVSLSISILAVMLLLTLIMGLTIQAPASQSGHHLLGFDTMTRSWPFVLFYLLLVVNLSSVTLRRLLRFTWRDYAFYLNHLGLLVLLFAAGLGASDLRRYVMHVEEGATEWRVYSETGDVLELPLAIQLNDFRMEEYAPSLAVIDRNTGDAYPAGNPQMWQIDTLRPTARIGEYEIKLTDYIEEAVRNADSTYRQVPMPGSTQAAEVEVTLPNQPNKLSGWISGGNYAQLYMTLALTDQHILVMTRPEPSLFQSDIVVYTKDEKALPFILEVNKPMRVGPWTIYQYGYDNDRGKASGYSSFELVYDPWLPAVYVGIILFLLGSILLLWEGSKKAKIKRNAKLG